MSDSPMPEADPSQLMTIKDAMFQLSDELNELIQEELMLLDRLSSAEKEESPYGSQLPVGGTSVDVDMTNTYETLACKYEPTTGTYKPITGTYEPITGTYEQIIGTKEYIIGTDEQMIDTEEHIVSMAEHNTGTAEHNTGTAEHNTGTAEHNTGTAEHNTDTAEHNADTAEHNTGTAEPDTDAAEHNASAAEHTAEHNTSTAEHDTSTAEHNADTAEHNADTAEHNTGTAEPDIDAAEHNASAAEHTAEHNTSTAEHDTSTAEHNTGTAEPNRHGAVNGWTPFGNSIEEEDDIIYSVRNWVWTLPEKDHLHRRNWQQWKSMWLRELAILGLRDHEHVMLLPFQWQQKIAAQMIRNMTQRVFDVVVCTRDFATIWSILLELEPSSSVLVSDVKSDEWIFDTGSAIHIVNDKSWLDGPIHPYVGVLHTGGGPVQPECVGGATLHVCKGDGSFVEIELRNVIVCPTFSKNVFSGQALFARNGYLTKELDVIMIFGGEEYTATRLGPNFEMKLQKIGAPYTNVSLTVDFHWN